MKRAQVHKNIQVPELVDEENKICFTDKVPNNLGQSPYTSTLENNLLNNNNSIEKQKMEHTNNNTSADMEILSKKLQPLSTQTNAKNCEPETTVQNDQPSIGDFADSLGENLLVPGNVNSYEAENQKEKPPRIRRISDVIDCIGDEGDTDKENRRMSSHSTPPLTPLFNTEQNTFQLKPETAQSKFNTQKKPTADTIDAAPLNLGEDQDVLMEE